MTKKSHSKNLNEQVVREIRAMHARGIMGYRRIGERFGVNEGTVQSIVKRKTWKWVE